MSGLFDTYLMVDWSGAATPRRGADSIWWALHRRGRGGAADGNPATRRAAVEILAHLIGVEADQGRRVLVGFDFPLGYPSGTARALTGTPGWQALWALLAARIVDGIDNRNNRFEVAADLNRRFPGVGPFWGRPQGLALPDLPDQGTARTPRDHPAERRLVERAVPGAQPVWKLYTTGSVGGQALVGIPALEHLRHDPRLAGRVQVWPFETGLAVPTAQVVLAEVYPSLYADAVAREQRSGEPKDRAQVRVVAETFRALDAAHTLAPLFAPPMPAADAQAVTEEEGWILGAGLGLGRAAGPASDPAAPGADPDPDSPPPAASGAGPDAGRRADAGVGPQTGPRPRPVAGPDAERRADAAAGGEAGAGVDASPGVGPDTAPVPGIGAAA